MEKVTEKPRAVRFNDEVKIITIENVNKGRKIQRGNIFPGKTTLLKQNRIPVTQLRRIYPC